MRRPITVAAEERQVRAGARVLAGLMAHPHPMIRRAINASLGELTWTDLSAFGMHLHAALLADTVPAESPASHLAELRQQYDATEARD